MIRVRICTKRCRCHNSCLRSRFSGLGTQICGKLFSSISLRRSCASSVKLPCAPRTLGRGTMRLGVSVLGLTTVLFGGPAIVLNVQQQDSATQITEADVNIV